LLEIYKYVVNVPFMYEKDVRNANCDTAIRNVNIEFVCLYMGVHAYEYVHVCI